mgnify:CR=1 FL=1
MNKIFLLLTSTTLAFLIASCEKEETPPGDHVFEHGPLHNYRYCEVLLADVDFGQGEINAEVYNSMTCNECPQAQWEVLDADSIADAHNVTAAILNGPRFWILDSISATAAPPGDSCAGTFGEIDMTLAASVTVPLGGGSTSPEPYTPAEVERNTLYYFYEGTRVYMLEDPDGKCYIMQSYSQIEDSSLQLEDLETLDTRLNLPSGWSFKTTVLENAFELQSDGLATVVQDDLTNTYQYLPDGCL